MCLMGLFITTFACFWHGFWVEMIFALCVCVCVCACVCVYVCVLYIDLVKSRYLLKLPGFLRVAFSKEEGEVSLASPLHVSSRTNLIST